jgi:hypothetical protein
VEKDSFWFDIMGTTVSAPSQAPAHLADKTPQELYYECLDKGDEMHGNFRLQIWYIR